MTTDDLRKLYIDFFKSKGHRAFSSDSLIPADDPSLLFTGAGMNQFKPYFLGVKKDVQRAVSCQKCLRTGDLDRVGKTAYHHTFFEMLGNFSFGDYFKPEAIAWGWEFVTKELKIPKEKLWVSVYEEDDEAFEIWKTKIGVPEARIVRMGPEDNFWPSNAPVAGPNGPCGPCSEIYVGETPGKGVEIWNLVFTQFDRQSDGSLKDLPQRNIDTGMGLERTAAVLQGVETNFEIDSFTKIRHEMRVFLDKAKRQREEKLVIAHENAAMDHARAVVFTIGDGALPSNEGRGYVIRKLIRLGSEHMSKAGEVKQGSFHKLVPIIVGVMGGVYPELSAREKTITAIVENEERAYLEVLRTQVPKLESEYQELLKKSSAGKDAGALGAKAAQIAFKYYDTYGVPLDVISSNIEKNLKIKLDENLFNKYLEEQKERSRQSSKIAGEIFSKKDTYGLADDIARTEFTGYHGIESDGTLLRIIKNNEKVEALKAGEEGLLIFDRTPFYGESGGQVGDTGEITGKDFKAIVLNTQHLEKATTHRVKVEKGHASEGGSFHLKVDAERRDDIMKNHTATHLLQSALRKVLGEHVKQSGSLVAPDRLRFDFTHFSAVAPADLEKVEALVNAEIKKNTALDKKVLAKEEALKEGAIAFFGEKYEEHVRVITIGDFSKELCGGTHLHSTGEIGLFKIISESSIQAGVRRIEAVTGRSAAAFIEGKEKEIDNVAGAFKVSREALPGELKKLGEKVSSLKDKLVNSANVKVRSRMDECFRRSQEVHGVKLVIDNINGADIELLKTAAEHLKNLKAPFTAILVSEFEDKISFVVAGSAELVQKGFHSGKIVKDIAAVVQGNGGGRPDFAVGGGKTLTKKSEAVELGKREIIKSLDAIFKGK